MPELSDVFTLYGWPFCHGQCILIVYSKILIEIVGFGREAYDIDHAPLCEGLLRSYAVRCTTVHLERGESNITSLPLKRNTSQLHSFVWAILNDIHPDLVEPSVHAPPHT